MSVKRSWKAILCFALLIMFCSMSPVLIPAKAESNPAEWVKADTVLNVGDSLLNESDKWTAEGGVGSVSEGTISYPTTDLVKLTNQNPNTNITYSFKMKLDASLPKDWLAYIGFRTNEFHAMPWERIDSGMYWLEFNKDRMALSKHVGNRAEIESASYSPQANFFVAEGFHEYCISVINDENGNDVNIIVYVDGVEAINVTDTDGVVHGGGFRVLTHNTGGGGIEHIRFQAGSLSSGSSETSSWPNPADVLDAGEWVKADTVVNFGTLLIEQPSMWRGQNAKVPVIEDGNITIGNNLYVSSTEKGAFWYNLSGTGSYKYQDATINFKVNFGTKTEEWLMMLSFRDTVPGIANWDPNKKSSYDIQINASSIDLRRITGGPQVIASYNPGTMYLLDDKFHEFAITTINEETGIRIYVYVDGVKAIEHLDTAPVDGSVADSEVLLDAGAITFNSTREQLVLQAGTLAHTEIKDTEPPTISATLPKTGVVGKAIRLPAGVVSDNMTDPSMMVVTRTVTDPDGKNVKIANREFIPEKAGEYHVLYTTTDAAGNEGKLEGTIVVSAAEGAVSNEKGLSGVEIGLIVAACVVVAGGGSAIGIWLIRRRKIK